MKKSTAYEQDELEMKGMADFRLSVVIPFFKDNDKVKLLLTSIERALDRLPGDAKAPEIILVDDHSPVPFDPDEAGLLPVRVERLDRNCGVGGARNRGASLSRGSHLLFIDSDVILEDRFFERLYKHLKLKRGPIIQGPSSPVPANCPAGLFHHYMAVSWNYYQTRNWDISIFTQCFIIEKEFFNLLGGFSEDYQRSGGEEFELGLRLARTGANHIFFDPGLIHYHHSENLIKRLRKVYFRSRHIRPIALSMPNLPFRFTAQSLLRSCFSLGLWLSFLFFLVRPGTGGGLLILMAALFYYTDDSFSSHMRRNHSLGLSLMSVFFRHLEYTFINLGMLSAFVSRRPAR